MSKKPLKATDRRRQRERAESVDESSDNGAGRALADLYNDRRRQNGTGKRAS